MDENLFWEIIERARKVNPYTVDAHEKQLIAQLDGLGQSEFADFIHILEQKCSDASNWDLWAVAWIVRDEFGDSGCGDDAFWGFIVLRINC